MRSPCVSEATFIGSSPNRVHAQVGDQLDRGDNELEILYWLERLQKEAGQAGASQLS